MVSIRLSVLAAVLLCASASVAQAATVTFDCTKVPNICSNDCENVRRNEARLTFLSSHQLTVGSVRCFQAMRFSALESPRRCTVTVTTALSTVPRMRATAQTDAAATLAIPTAACVHSLPSSSSMHNKLWNLKLTETRVDILHRTSTPMLLRKRAVRAP